MSARNPNNFTTQEQIAGYRWLQMTQPEVALGNADDPDTLAAWMDACEDVVALGIVSDLQPVRWDRVKS